MLKFQVMYLKIILLKVIKQSFSKIMTRSPSAIHITSYKDTFQYMPTASYANSLPPYVILYS